METEFLLLIYEARSAARQGYPFTIVIYTRSLPRSNPAHVQLTFVVTTNLGRLTSGGLFIAIKQQLFLGFGGGFEKVQQAPVG